MLTEAKQSAFEKAFRSEKILLGYLSKIVDKSEE